MSALTQIVQIHDWNDELVQVRLFQLIQWKHAMALEEKGMPVARRSVTAHVRKALSAPRSFTRAQLINYITESIDDINQQLGVK